MSVEPPAQISRLLEKYFSAETSVEEERRLTAYFRSGEVADEHLEWRSLFDWKESGSALSLSPDFENRVMQRLPAEATGRVIPLRRILAYAAAVLLIVTAGWWLLNREQMSSREEALMADTWDDPEEAYQQFAAALSLVSGAMDQGQTLTVESVAPAQELDIFSTQ